jgi:cobalt-zinc-cadmium resistance protein CzcA
VDATVIMVENIFRHLAQPARARFAATGALDRKGGVQSFFGKLGIIELSSAEVNRAIFFAAAIIIAGFLPLFTLTGVEGHIFGPMAKTYAYAIVGGLIATFTIAPVLSAFLLKEEEEEKETLIVRAMRRVYDPALRFALGNRIVALGGMGAAAGGGDRDERAGAGIPAQAGGRQFLDQGDLAPSISLEEAQGRSIACATC